MRLTGASDWAWPAAALGLRPGTVSIPVGAFADPDFPPPTAEVYRERAQRGLNLTIDPPPVQE